MTFEIFDGVSDFRWRLVGGNGEIVAASQGYTTKASAEATIASIKANAASAAVIDLTK
jgi:uncharacterized protein